MSKRKNMLLNTNMVGWENEHLTEDELQILSSKKLLERNSKITETGC